MKKISRFMGELGFVHDDDGATSNDKPAKKEIIGAARPTAPADLKSAPATPASIAGITSFSFSQLRSYAQCPYQYKLGTVLKLPTKGNANFSFGSSMHLALQKFYERVQELNSLQQTNLFGAPAAPARSATGVKVPSLEELLDIYRRSWIDDWYGDAAERERQFAAGEKILRLFYKENSSSWNIPLRLEGWFKIHLGAFTMSGRIDRIDQLPDGALEIIDYKTGKAKDKLVGDDKDQLLLYQLAVQDVPEYRQFGVPSKLTFYYLNENAKLSFLGTPEEIAGLQEKLLAAIAAIRAGDFTATPSPYTCRSCEFRDICEFRQL